ncbi:anaerobic carbon-monoxide dehydrogenase catalytic subunit [Desulfovulcanus sp.]
MEKKEIFAEKSYDPAAQEMLKLAERKGYETVWERLKAQSRHCKFGVSGVCCKNCVMGPCRITPKVPQGVCGATADIIVARNLIRAIAAGAAAHSDHGRPLTVTLKEVAEGENKDYQIKDVDKLKSIAGKLGLDSGADVKALAKAVAEVGMKDYGKQDDKPIQFLLSYAPKKRLECWQNLENSLFEKTGKKMGVLPRNIDREIVDIMHRTHMGVDNDPVSLLIQGVRAALGDGWGGSLIATEIQDILFGRPTVKKVMANLGVLDADYVNIVVHGHEPILSEKIVEVAQSEEMQQLAQKYGAKGINVVGMCCTGNELLMRQGVPVAGNELHQELAVMTGAVEAVVVDVQCIFPALGRLVECFHTKFISTSEQAKFPGSLHIQFEESKATQVAKQIVKIAIEAFPQRDKDKVFIPRYKSEAIVGFTTENIISALGGTPKPLVDAIVSGKIKGVVGIVGCNNPKVKQDYNHVNIARELIKKDILVIGTGCWAIACAKAGLMRLEAAELAGEGLKEICKALNIPPVLHMGSCVDCSRMLTLAGGLADYLDVDISDLPLVGSAPEWMTEKAVSIGTYFVASGIPVHLWPMPPITGSETVVKILTEDIKDFLGGYFFVEEDPVRTADMMEEIIMDKRKALNI